MLLGYIYIKIKYFTVRNNFPGVSPNLIFGNLLQSGMLLNGTSTAEIFLSYKHRFGNIFQFWLGFTRVIIASDINDVQYIFNNRHIYDLGDLFVDKLGSLFPDSLMGIKGATYKRHAALIRPIFRRANVIPHQYIIIDCVDQLLNKWRKDSDEKINIDIVKQCQNLLLEIFGFIALDYDLETLDNDDMKNQNELAEAIRTILSTTVTILQLPTTLGKIYLKISSKYRQAQLVIEKYCHEIIQNELAQSADSIAQRKRSSFIAALVSSLQQDEISEALKSDEDKTGNYRILIKIKDYIYF